jgi:hypothetical protein
MSRAIAAKVRVTSLAPNMTRLAAGRWPPPSEWRLTSAANIAVSRPISPSREAAKNAWAISSPCAREHVQAERPRYPVERAHGLEIAQAFFAASREGEIRRLTAMLAADVSLHSDGGGQRPAASRVMLGASEVTRTFAAIARLMRGQKSELVRYAYVNGLPGFVTREPDGILQTTALLIEHDRVKAIYVMRNPDKLRHLETRLH